MATKCYINYLQLDYHNDGNINLHNINLVRYIIAHGCIRSSIAQGISLNLTILNISLISYDKRKYQGERIFGSKGEKKFFKVTFFEISRYIFSL